MLLYQGMMDARNEGAPYAFLSPANEEIYKPFGFQGVYYRKQMEIKGDGTNGTMQVPFRILTAS